MKMSEGECLEKNIRPSSSLALIFCLLQLILPLRSKSSQSSEVGVAQFDPETVDGYVFTYFHIFACVSFNPFSSF